MTGVQTCALPIFHGKEAYDSAVRISKALFSGDIKSLSIDEISEGFKDVPSITIAEDMNLVDALIASKLASSKREAREFIKNNAVSVNGVKVTDLEFMVSKENAIENEFTVLKKGKKKYALIKH